MTKFVTIRETQNNTVTSGHITVETVECPYCGREHELKDVTPVIECSDVDETTLFEINQICRNCKAELDVVAMEIW